MDVHAISSVLAIICTLFYSLQWCYKFGRNLLITPVVQWGFIDCPNSSEAHYYMIVKPRWSKKEKQNVTLVLDVGKRILSDYGLSVVDFHRRIGREHFQETILEQKKTTETTMSTLYKVKVGVPYRIVVQVSGGEAWTFPFEHFELQVEALGAMVKCRHNSLQV